MGIPNPDSPQWAEYLSQAFAKLRMRAQPDPYATAHEYAGAIPTDYLPTRAMPQAVIPHYTKDDEPHPATHGMEGEDE
jgi:hypothetical protein